MLDNVDFYGSFVCDLKASLHRFVHNKEYENDVGDVIINALSNLFSRPARVYD